MPGGGKGWFCSLNELCAAAAGERRRRRWWGFALSRLLFAVCQRARMIARLAKADRAVCLMSLCFCSSLSFALVSPVSPAACSLPTRPVSNGRNWSYHNLAFLLMSRGLPTKKFRGFGVSSRESELRGGCDVWRGLAQDHSARDNIGSRAVASELCGSDGVCVLNDEEGWGVEDEEKGVGGDVNEW